MIALVKREKQSATSPISRIFTSEAGFSQDIQESEIVIVLKMKNVYIWYMLSGLFFKRNIPVSRVI